ncbi:universal stress protein [Pseudotabrizicola sediminis]|uniref:Universal stress protein n=1 Tax=Pseudotabrizicola sediminis TaxID=2486418 RepID=A0ABY2KLY0_9RHOB|nr:universal stress protein [Pseudotabrizicola sediminis]TGD43086.1 universal stress protein [Pseudotabrizicola sediminis]
MEELAGLDAQRSKLMALRGRAILDDAQAILTRAGVAEITTRLRHGDIVDTVAEVEQDAGMILIGKRGEAADFAKGHLGSNLERIVRASHKPVFVASRAFRPIEKVLVAYDGGASAMKAVDHISRSALFAGLSVVVATVGSPSAEVKHRLENAHAQLRAAGLAAETKIVEGQPETALGKLVDAEGFDMLVMGAYGHSRIRSLVIGSTTTEMLRSCKVPVVLVK